ncbi:MAG TPA: glycosyltransferase [Mycobacteriales bacterium]|nr:glycosyltransferase [Mycobacteriales bacterium]
MQHAPPPVAVVVPTWNGRDLLRDCLRALAAQDVPAAEVVVVDNGSTDGTRELLAAEFPDVRLVAFDRNSGFAPAVNAGIRATSTPWVALLNNDALPDPDWLGTLAREAAAAGERTAFLTSKIVSLDGTLLDSAGDYLDNSLAAGQRGHREPDDGRYDAPEEVFSGCGGATLYRRSALDALGGFDERFFAYYEDVDLSFRARLAGLTGLYVPTARVRHHVSATSARQPGMKRYLSTRNSWFLVGKNVPGPVLRAQLPNLLLRQVLWLVSAAREGELAAALRGHLAALRALPWLLARRREIQRGAVLRPEEVAAWLRPARMKERVGEVALKGLGWGDALAPGAPFNPDAAARYDVAVRVVEATDPKRVLEVGSGTGGLAEYARPPLLVGTDLDFAATSDRDGSGLVPVRASAVALPFADGAFDLVVSMDMLEHVPRPDRARVVAELLRVARPGAVVVCGVPAGRAAERADRWLDALHTARRGEPHPWVREHLDLGLPGRGELVRAFRDVGARKVVVRGNVNVAVWRLMHRVLESDDPGLLARRATLALARRVAVGPYYRTVVEAVR